MIAEYRASFPNKLCVYIDRTVRSTDTALRLPFAAVHIRRPGLGCRINQQMPLEARSYDVATVSRARCSTVTSLSGLDVRARPTCPPVPPARGWGSRGYGLAGNKFQGLPCDRLHRRNRGPLLGGYYSTARWLGLEVSWKIRAGLPFFWFVFVLLAYLQLEDMAATTCPHPGEHFCASGTFRPMGKGACSLAARASSSRCMARLGTDKTSLGRVIVHIECPCASCSHSFAWRVGVRRLLHRTRRQASNEDSGVQSADGCA